MIADQAVNAATGFGCLFLERHEEVHDFAGVRAAVEEVARLNQVRLSAGPFAFLVDDLGGAEHRDEGVVVAVSITHGDDSLDAGEGILRQRGIAAGEEKEQDQDEHGRKRLTVVPWPG